MKLLFLDIETSPTTAYTWNLFNAFIGVDQIIEPTRMICFAAKWQGSSPMIFRSVHDADMLDVAWELFDSADAIVHYNGAKFDVPHLNREFLEHGFGPPSPYAQVDLYKVVRQRFKFISNKLAHVVDRLGVGNKIKTDFDLWKGCMNDDPQSWKLMEKYNRQDVKVLESLYDELLPWIPAHPSRTLIDGITGCPTCGDPGPLQKRGFYFSKLSKFQRLQCKACGSWHRSSLRTSGVSVQQAATL